MYHALFSNNPIVLVRVCDLINRFPEYILKEVREDFLAVLWYNKLLPFKSDNANIKALEVLFKEYYLTKAFEWRQHLALECYNTKILRKVESIDDFENFLKYAHTQYPYVCTFLEKTV